MKEQEEYEKVNYDLPLSVYRISINDERKDEGLIFVNKRKLVFQWIDINNLEEYPKELEQVVDWKEYKDVDKYYIQAGGEVFLVLGSMDEMLKYWQYYLKNVKIWDKWQTPNYKRRK